MSSSDDAVVAIKKYLKSSGYDMSTEDFINIKSILLNHSPQPSDLELDLESKLIMDSL